MPPCPLPLLFSLRCLRSFPSLFSIYFAYRSLSLRFIVHEILLYTYQVFGCWLWWSFFLFIPVHEDPQRLALRPPPLTVLGDGVLALARVEEWRCTGCLVRVRENCVTVKVCRRFTSNLAAEPGLESVVLQSSPVSAGQVSSNPAECEPGSEIADLSDKNKSALKIHLKNPFCIQNGHEQAGATNDQSKDVKTSFNEGYTLACSILR